MSKAEDVAEQRNCGGYYDYIFEIEARHKKRFDCNRVVSSVGLEHHVDNVRVAGSNPAQPTIFCSTLFLTPPISGFNYTCSRQVSATGLCTGSAGPAGNLIGASFSLTIKLLHGANARFFPCKALPLQLRLCWYVIEKASFPE